MGAPSSGRRYLIPPPPKMEMGSGRIVATLALGALVLIAVSYMSENPAEVVPEIILNSATAKDLPESVDGFVELSVSNGKSGDSFHTYQTAKANAKKVKGKEKEFQAAEHTCSMMRTSSYHQCGKQYCAAKKTCGAPCQKLFGQPRIQVVPLNEHMGAKFYKVKEVGVKEKGVKMVRANEREKKAVDAEIAVKKEKKYKESVVKENADKVKKRAELQRKEVVKKELGAKQRKADELQNKRKEITAKQAILLKCDAKAELEHTYCEVKVEQEKKLAAATAIAKSKAAAAAAAAAIKKAAEAANPNSTVPVAAALAAKNATGNAALVTNATARIAYEKEQNAIAAANAANSTAIQANFEKSKFDVTEENYLKGEVDDPLPLPKDVVQAAADDEAYAEKVITNNGRRLLSMDMDMTAPEVAGSAEKIIELKKAVVTDEKKLAEEHHAAGLATNATGKAQNEVDSALGKMNSDHDGEKSADNAAREDAGFAALAEARVQLIDSWVRDHRGNLHKTNCSSWKKFAFDVCMGRDVYKRQLIMTKKSAEKRSAADKLKEDMAADYAQVLEKNKTSVAVTKEAADTAKAVVETRKKLTHDQGELSEEEGEVAAKESAIKLDIKRKKRLEEERKVAAVLNAAPAPAPAPAPVAAPAAPAPAPVAAPAPAPANEPAITTATDTTQVELYNDDEDEFEEDEPEDLFVDEETLLESSVGRRLLDDDSDPAKETPECAKATDTAFQQCKGDVEKAYATCAKHFDKIRL